MGSRIMHLIISNEIANQISIADKNAFLLGGIAPDAVSPKELSHFFEGNHNDFSRRISYEKFYGKYSKYDQSDYILGYYTHLIADDLWLKGFYLPWLKNRLENDEAVFNRYHHDFRLLNGKLLSYYDIGMDVLEGLETIDHIPDLGELTAVQAKKLLPYVEEDMNYSPKDLDEQLTVFTLDQIIGYIETSVEKSIFLIKEKL